MDTLDEYLAKFPEHAFNFDHDLSEQPRIYDLLQLAQLPIELATDIAPEAGGGRSRAKRNQCRTHAQCTDCGRLLRNDAFYSPPSFRAKNRTFTYCKECSLTRNADRYSNNKEIVSARRDAIWQYLAPYCVACGGIFHPSAMDMHHTGNKEDEVNKLITPLTFVPAIRHAEKLIAEARKCIPLCSNCHRALHAGTHVIIPNTHGPKYSTWELLDMIAELEL